MPSWRITHLALCFYGTSVDRCHVREPQDEAWVLYGARGLSKAWCILLLPSPSGWAHRRFTSSVKIRDTSLQLEQVEGDACSHSMPWLRTNRVGSAVGTTRREAYMVSERSAVSYVHEWWDLTCVLTVGFFRTEEGKHTDVCLEWYLRELAALSTTIFFDDTGKWPSSWLRTKCKCYSRYIHR